jgi:hypothetical protein
MNKSKSYMLGNIMFVIFAVILLALIFLFGVADRNVKFECFEDKSGVLQFQQITSEKFQTVDQGYLKGGINQSKWWVRFKTDEDDGRKNVLVINNSMLEAATLYYQTKDSNAYSEIHAGWRYKDAENNEYEVPVFNIPENEKGNSYLYVSLESPYSLTCNFYYMTPKEFSHYQNINIFVQEILISLLLIMLLYNLVYWANIKGFINLYYIFYLLALIIYHTNSVGLFWLASPRYMIWASGIGLNLVYSYAVMISSILFVQFFLDTKNRYSVHNKILNSFKLLCVSGIGMLVFHNKYMSNIFSSVLAIILMLYIVLLTVHALKKGQEGAVYLFYGFSLTFLGNLVLILGLTGIIPNENIMLYAPIIAAWLTSMLFSDAVVDLVNQAHANREKATQLVNKTDDKTRVKLIGMQKTTIDTNVLFEALSAAAGLCLHDTEKARNVMFELSSFLRYNFDFNQEAAAIFPEDEMEKIITYININNVIYRDQIDMEYRFDETNGLLIHSMIMQPIILSAIRHSLNGKDKGKVVFEIIRQNDRFVISVTDNGLQIGGNGNKGAIKKAEDDRNLEMKQVSEYVRDLYGTELIIKGSIDAGITASFEILKPGH